MGCFPSTNTEKWEWSVKYSNLSLNQLILLTTKRFDSYEEMDNRCLSIYYKYKKNGTKDSQLLNLTHNHIHYS